MDPTQKAFDLLWPSDTIWLRQWLVAWRHQAITKTDVDQSSVRPCGIHLQAISQEILKISICNKEFVNCYLTITTTFPRDQWVDTESISMSWPHHVKPSQLVLLSTVMCVAMSWHWRINDMSTHRFPLSTRALSIHSNCICLMTHIMTCRDI